MPITNLGYGHQQIRLELADHQWAGLVDTNTQQQADVPEKMISQALEQPIGSLTLKQIAAAKAAKSALIVVNDITRPTPYQLILPPLLEELAAAGIPDQAITLLVATGIHRAHTEEENCQLYTSEICSRYRVVSHDCDHDVIPVGKLSNGTPLKINRLVREHDLLITTGLIGLHYFAGYSGGRKSILPGIASRDLIAANHAMMIDERCRLDNISDNPVHKIMVEASRLAGVDFIINVVTDAHGHLVAAVAGDVIEAWEQGVKISRQLSTISLDRPASIVLASCGGFPKDINLYQAQKALDGASLAVKPGGCIILLAECREGLGEETFRRWILEAASPQSIEQRIRTQFELGGHKAYAISRLTSKAKIILVSSLEPQLVRKCYMEPADSLDQALQIARQDQGADARILVMPHAANVAVRIG
ncbi:MAG: nickel-dependent lactate racemase [Methylocystaceae bacterium]